MTDSKWDDARDELVERCDGDVRALVDDARRAGLMPGDTVIVIADRRDGRAKVLLEAAEELGLAPGDETVAVLGLPRELAQRLAMSVDASLGRAMATPLDELEPELLVLAFDQVGRGPARRGR
jgi:hypothetical protein